MPLLAVLPAFLIVATGYVTESKYRWGVPLMILFVLSAGAAITSLGLAMAARFSRVDRAVGSTVTIYVLITVAWVFVVTLLCGPQLAAVVDDVEPISMDRRYHRRSSEPMAQSYGLGVILGRFPWTRRCEHLADDFEQLRPPAWSNRRSSTVPVPSFLDRCD